MKLLFGPGMKALGEPEFSGCETALSIGQEIIAPDADDGFEPIGPMLRILGIERDAAPR